VTAESGLRLAESLLNNRSRRHVLGQRIVHFSEYSRRVEKIFLPEDGPTELGANISIANAEWAQGGRTPNRGWCSVRTGFGTRTGRWVRGGVEEGAELGREEGQHGILQEAYDADCTAIARALAVAAERSKRHKLGRVRIFTDAMTRVTHGEPGPGQTYALQARKVIAALREREPSVEIEIRWCPAHKGIPDGWPNRPPASRMTTGPSG